MNAEAMKSYLLQPLAPLVVRSGRPFDDQAGADAARFPPPSTLAGALRSALADTRGEAYSAALLEVPVRGPLPARLSASGQPGSLLVPRPADALCFWSADKRSKRLVRAAPAAFAAGEGADLPAGLLPVRLVEPVRGKPAPAPAWWALEDFLRFRCGESLDMQAIAERVAENGWTPNCIDPRTHVAIDPSRQAAANGKLFQTTGMEFIQRVKSRQHDTIGEGALSESLRPIGLFGSIAGDIAPGVIPLGGERRLSAIGAADESLWPEADAAAFDAITAAGGVVLSLLTPALFAEGWQPGWLQPAGLGQKGYLEGTPPGCEGVTLRLRAAALDRWQPHSGWDLAARQPRAGRKLVPAGAAYWFEIIAGDGAALRPLWLGSVCDGEQDRRDGFGLALIHPWSPMSGD